MLHFLGAIVVFCSATFCSAGAALKTDVQTENEVRSPGKPNAGLAVISGSQYRVQTGRVQSLRLTLSSATRQGLLRVTVSSSQPELEVLSPTQYEFDLAEEDITLNLQLMPHEDGRYYLMLNASIEREGQPSQAQSLGVAVQAGDAETTQSLKAEPAPEVILLPAQETIRTR